MADRFGLADLYQLRGRVGRTERRAYAYLFYSEERLWNPEAKKRLKAIRDFTALGSGIKVAMKDLEIRGAGNLLGKEQSGHIASIGFKLYCELLDKYIAQRKGEPYTEEKVVQCKLDVPLSIPPSYISEPELRLVIYQKIAKIRTDKDQIRIKKELQDRFGPFPQSLKNLFDIVVLKRLANGKEIESITINKKYLLIKRCAKTLYRNQIDFDVKKHPSKLFKMIYKIIQMLPN